jgi:hypothetical protein
MKSADRILRAVADKDVTLTLMGESGTVESLCLLRYGRRVRPSDLPRTLVERAAPQDQRAHRAALRRVGPGKSVVRCCLLSLFMLCGPGLHELS